MNSQQHKEKFGVSKTTYKNMKEKGLLQEGKVTPESLAEYKAIRKARKAKIRRIAIKKHEILKILENVVENLVKDVTEK